MILNLLAAFTLFDRSALFSIVRIPKKGFVYSTFQLITTQYVSLAYAKPIQLNFILFN